MPARTKRPRRTTITLLAQTRLATTWGTFKIYVYRGSVDAKEHIAMVMGDVKDIKPVLTRIHSECLTGDVFGSTFCDCGPQLHAALDLIKKKKRGVLLYLRQEGRGIGLSNKIKAYELQEQGYDTVEANTKLGLPVDARDYSIAASILHHLGIFHIRLMTNNPEKVLGMEMHSVRTVETTPLKIPLRTARGRRYQKAKKTKLGHLL